MNKNQSKFIVSSNEDALFVNLENKTEIDIDQQYGLQKIKDIEYDEEDKIFYVSSNMYMNKFGVYIQRIYEDEPTIESKVIKWHTRLEIGDVDLYIMRNNALGLKELVIGYR